MLRIASAACSAEPSATVSKRKGSRVWSITTTRQPSCARQIVR
jgi:hypothetical protein